uniref:ATP synthase subunit O, mitochondrial n=1 Tax=Quercus lobata TaxID=97700 RepID=A0A7N2LCL3_QUELO
MFSRNYAAATGQKEERVKVPLALFGGSGNYASALYIAAVRTNSVDKVETELLDLVEAIKRSPTFAQFTRDHSVPAKTRVKAIQEIAGGAKFSEITKNFLGFEPHIYLLLSGNATLYIIIIPVSLIVVLAENGRLRNIDSIAKRFGDLTMAYKGEVKAIVTTVIVSSSLGWQHFYY